MKSIIIHSVKEFNSKFDIIPPSLFSEDELDIFKSYLFYPVKNKKDGKTTIITSNSKLVSIIARDSKALHTLFKYYNQMIPIVLVKESVYYQIVDLSTVINDELTIHSEEDAVNLFNGILKDAIRKNASDIHFVWTKDYVVVKYRIDGEVVTQNDKLFTHKIGETIRNICINETGESEDEKNEVAGKFSKIIDYQEREYRLSIGPSIYGYNIVIRAESKINESTKLEDWGYTQKAIELIEKFKRLPYGIVLVTGPTGSGKSTLLYTIANEIYQEEDKIIKTVEDPVEIQINGIHQVQVNMKGDKSNWMTFEKAIKMFLRQDPDVIIVGEMRDSEVARAALSAAKTGHLTFSTLHTNDVKSTISRLIDMDIDIIDIEDGLRGVISQRLINTLCDGCKIPVKEGTKVYYKRDPKGCENCFSSKILGYKGRVPIVEIALLNSERENYKSENFEEYYTRVDNIMELLEMGKIDRETAVKFIDFENNQELERESEMINIWNIIKKEKSDSPYIKPHYQPIFNELGDRVMFETYMRLKNLNGDILYAQDIIPITKKLDIYRDLSIYFFDRVIDDYKKLDKPIFINVDSELLRSDSYCDHLVSKLQKNHLIHKIIIETGFSRDDVEILHRLNRDYNIEYSLHNFDLELKDIEFMISNDYTPSFIKTSKSFIENIDNNFEISKNYINILKNLNSNIIISYIDSKKQLNYLNKIDPSLLKMGYILDREKPL